MFLAVLATMFSLGCGKYCQNSDYVDGHWISDDPKNTSFPCCPGHGIRADYYYNPDVLKRCSTKVDNEAIVQGSILEHKYPKSAGHGCTCRAFGKRNGLLDNEPLASEKYAWKPNQCDMIQWDALKFCKLLKGRIVLMVVFEMSDYLVDNPDEHRGKRMFIAWETYKPDILIISTGPHWHKIAFEEFGRKDDTDFMNQYRPKLREDLQYIMTDDKKPMKLLWKTETPGHDKCEQFNGPVDSVSYLALEDMTHLGKIWRTGAFIDEMSFAIGQEFGMDVINMTALRHRPDAHSFPDVEDCLHYCLPGPLNVFAEILLLKLFNGEI